MYRAEDVGAIYWATFATSPRHSSWNGNHWLPEATEPPVEAIVGALTGNGPPLSVYFLTDDATTHVGAIDVDDAEGWPTVEKITIALLEADVVAYPEHSRRGGHIWIVADRRLPAIAFRFALMAAVEKAGFNPSDPHIELRPNTDRHSSIFAGGALRAPWMAHPATGERYGLLNPLTMQPLHPKIAGALLRLDHADHRAVAALAERHVPPALEPEQPARRHEQGSVTDVLQRGWGVVARPGQSIRCPLHDDQHPSMKIAPDDRRAWCHAPACVLYEDGRGVTAWRLEQLANGVAA